MYIKTPISNKRIFLDNSISNYNERLDQIYRKVFMFNKGEIHRFCNNNKFILNKYQLDSYLRSEKILENLATYLLLGDYSKNNIMTLNFIRKMHEKEIPISNVKGNASDLIYSASQPSDDNMTLNAKKELNDSEPIRDEQNKSQTDKDKEKKKEKKRKGRYRNSKTYKINKIYSTKPLQTYEIVDVKNHEVEYINENNVKVTYKDMVSDENAFEETKNKNAKDAIGQRVLKTKPKKIGGYKGLLGVSEKYISDWCLVDTDNIFEFKNKKYKISDKLKQYKVENKPSETFYEFENKCLMDKIFCIYSYDKDCYYFFDQDINRLKSSDVQEVK